MSEQNDNPYRAPSASGGANDEREDLRKIAQAQKGIIFCILANTGVLIGTISVPGFAPVLRVLALLVAVTSAVFVFQLARRIFGVGLAIACLVFTVIPGIGLILLLVVNQRATRLLQENGIEVGLFGAKGPV